MAGHETRPVRQRQSGVLERTQDGQADRHQRRLGILGQRQILARPVEHQPGEPLRQRIVHFLENQTGHARRFGEVPAHANGLGPLPRKDENAICHDTVLKRLSGMRVLSPAG